MSSGIIVAIKTIFRSAIGINNMQNVIREKNIPNTITNARNDFETLYFEENLSTKLLNMYAIIEEKQNGSRTNELICLKKSQIAIETIKKDSQNLVVSPKKRLFFIF